MFDASFRRAADIFAAMVMPSAAAGMLRHAYAVRSRHADADAMFFRRYFDAASRFRRLLLAYATIALPCQLLFSPLLMFSAMLFAIIMSSFDVTPDIAILLLFFAIFACALLIFAMLSPYADLPCLYCYFLRRALHDVCCRHTLAVVSDAGYATDFAFAAVARRYVITLAHDIFR